VAHPAGKEMGVARTEHSAFTVVDDEFTRENDDRLVFAAVRVPVASGPRLEFRTEDRCSVGRGDDP
jgi:hypothetical protein